jgi:hypothetical protein
MEQMKQVTPTPGMRRPDFFIVGAPKCGTTALIEYLKQHPDVFVPERKELDYFGSDLVFKDYSLSEERYLSWFTGANGQKRAGEGSVWYLRSTRAAAEIKAFSPTARIIIMLRNPVDVMHALHSQRVYNGNEDIEDFAAALEAEEDRRRGLRLPQRATDDFGCFYRETVRYARQIERYFDVFGRDRVRVILYDDFARETARVYRETCRFLEIDENFQPSLHVVNARKRVRSGAVREFLRRPPAPARFFLRALGLRPDRNGGYKGWLRRVNSTAHSLRPLDPELRKTLQGEFQPDVSQLSNLLGRDLTHWCST